MGCREPDNPFTKLGQDLFARHGNVRSEEMIATTVFRLENG